MIEGISRSRVNKVIGGVAGGLGKYLTIDPIIIRVFFVLSVFFSGIGILLYIIMWIVVPEEKYNFENTSNKSSQNNEDIGNSDNAENINFILNSKSRNDGKVILGIILILIGLFFFGIEIFSFMNFEDFFPMLLIGLGILLIWKSKKRWG